MSGLGKGSGRPRVALLIESSRAYGRGTLLGVAKYVREHGPWSIFLQERGLADVPPNWLKDWVGEGVIARVENQAMAEAIHRLKVPAVDLRYVLPHLKMPSVRTDDVAVSRLACEHLRERGFRHFGFCGFNGADYSDLRCRSFCECVAELGLCCHVFINPEQPKVSGTLKYEEQGLVDGERVAQWLKRLPKPLGLMACNDIRGQEVLGACRAIGLGVPDEVAVVGVDNDPVLCDLSDPPLSSVIPHTERIGYEAAALLAQMMNGGKPPEQPLVIEPMGIVTRRSTDVLAIEDPHIAAALRFIRDHACEGIDVGDVLRIVPLSRSTLERRFAQVLNRSPKDEILRVRLNRAKQLLADTDFPLWLIAEKIGLDYAEYFSVIFKKKTGLTPGGYRSRSKIAVATDMLPARN